MKITFLILFGFLLIALGSLVFLARAIRDNVELQYSQAAEEPLVDFAHLFASLIEADIVEGKVDPARFRESFQKAYRREFLARIYHLEKSVIQTHVYVTDEKGTVIFDSEDGKREGQDYSRYNDVYLNWQGEYGVRSSRVDPENSQTSVFFIGAPIRHGDKMIGTLTVFRPETAMAPFADQSRRLIARWSMMAALVTIILGALWVYWLLNPIRTLTDHAGNIARGQGRALPVAGHAELRELSIVLEEMRRELEGKHYVENYVQALTHELKSPLAAIRGAAELIDESMPAQQREQFLDNILVQTARSEDLVRRLVQLASLESQSSLATREPVSLPDLVSEAIRESETVIESRQLSVETSGCDDPVTVEGDPLMLRIAIQNIVKNAIDFSPENGSIEVQCTSEGGQVRLSVRDEGPGLPDYAGGRVFERFYSLKNQQTGRRGSGIGLCFVKESMDLHGGEVRLENHAEGGAVATLIFPIPVD